MPFRITITEIAEQQLLALPAHDQRRLQAAIAARLVYQPTTQTRAVRRLRPNPVAEWELRAGDLRALYNVEGDEVVVIVIVGRKVGNKLVVDGEEFHAHQDDPLQPPGVGPAEHPE